MWRFCFTRIRLNPLNSKVLDFVIGRNQVTKLFCTKWSFASTFSAGSPCYLGSQADIAISVFWEVSKNTLLPRFRCHCHLIPENCVQIHAILFLSDFLWNLLTSQEDLPTDHSESFLSLLFFWGVLNFWEWHQCLGCQFVTSLWYWTWRWTWSRWHQLPGCSFRIFSQRVLWWRWTKRTAFRIGGYSWNDKRYEVIRLADNTLPVFGQSWLLTADPS